MLSHGGIACENLREAQLVGRGGLQNPFPGLSAWIKGGSDTVSPVAWKPRLCVLACPDLSPSQLDAGRLPGIMLCNAAGDRAA